jgi:hypothetical protein
MKLIAGIMLVFFSGEVIAQNNVAHFSFWKIKPGQAQQFENGYKQHLTWHKDNGDTWSWYGWYVISGARADLFIDATFNHGWSDFDNPVKPAEDRADNNLHTHPFGNFEGGYKMIQLTDLSIGDSHGLQSKFLRLVTIHVTDIDNGKKVIERLKTHYQSAGIKTFLPFKMVDGGNLNQLLVLIGINSFQEYGKMDKLQEELSAIETTLKIKTITSIAAETLIYRSDMSLIQE